MVAEKNDDHSVHHGVPDDVNPGRLAPLSTFASHTRCRVSHGWVNRCPLPVKHRGKGVNRAVLDRILASTPFIIVVVIAAVAATYGYPQTDDYCSWGRLDSTFGGNAFADTWNFYFTWAGRYSAIFIINFVWVIGVSLPIPLQAMYAIALLFGMLFVLVASYLVTYSSLARPGKIVALVIAAGCMAIMPSKLEGLIWLSGAVVYTFGAASLLAVIGSVSRDRSRVNWLSIALIILACGFNEFIGLGVGIFLCCRAILLWRQMEFRTQSIVYVGVFIVAFLVSVAAPGNFARDATVAASKHDIIGSIVMAAGSLDLIITHLVKPNSWQIIALVVAAFLSGWGNQPSRDWRVFAASSTALFSSLPLHLFLYPFLLGEPVAGRSLNEATILVLAGTLLVAAWLGAYASTRMKFHAPVSLLNGVIFVTGLVVWLSPATQQYTTAIRDYGPQWKSAQEQRHAILVSSSGDVVVPALPKETAWPPVFLGTDLQEDPGYWVNRCTANFYGLDSVAVPASD